MNESIILDMARPYVKDGAITYDEFENIFSILSLHEKYDVIELLFRNGINLLDEYIDEETLILDDDEQNGIADGEEAEFEILYNKSIFADQNSEFEDTVINRVVRQTNEMLCHLIQAGNRQAEQDLCIKNKKLVDKYVVAYEKRYGNRLEFEDLEQVGFLGLIKAAKKFDIQLGTAFSTYAVHWIKQSISREIMDNGYALRIPVHMMERINKVVATDNRLFGLGLSFRERICQISTELGLKEDDVRECLMLKRNYLSYSSLDTPIGEDGDSELGEFVVDENGKSVEQIVMIESLRDEIKSILGELRLREREVIESRFGFKDDHPRTLEEVGVQYGVTRERIRQIEAKVLKKLKNSPMTKHIRDYLEEF